MSSGRRGRMLAGMKAEQTVAAAPQTAPRRRGVGLRRIYLLLCLLLRQFPAGHGGRPVRGYSRHHPGAHPASYFAGAASSIGWAIPYGGAWLAIHVALGLALVLMGLAGLLAARRTGGSSPIATAALGLLAILGAAFNGASFLSHDEDFLSLIMAGCFAIALASYTLGLYQRSDSARHPP